jgi:hypothetical protein
MAFRLIEVASWIQYRDLLDGPEFRSWAFRGHSDARWSIESTLGRYLKQFGVESKAWAHQEERIVRIFQRKAHLFLDHVPSDDDVFQWLALMQHHGAPTRLIDFTWSPFVAAFFALERATVDAAVWAVRPPGIWKIQVDVGGRSGVSTTTLGLREPRNYREYYLTGATPFVTTGEPRIMNRRLIAQSGTFVVPSVLDRPVELILGEPGPSSDFVTKFVLRTEKLRDEAMAALYNMNLTHATLSRISTASRDPWRMSSSITGDSTRRPAPATLGKMRSDWSAGAGGRRRAHARSRGR